MKFLKKVVDFLFPEICVLCNLELYKSEKHICASCCALLPLYIPNIYESHKKFLGRINISDLNGMFLYSKSSYVRKLIHHIKYRGGNDLAHVLGEQYAAKNNISKYDLIVPVPLHAKKMKKRGYNQSMEWAKGIAKNSNVEVKEVISRIVNTETQTKRKRINRWENVKRVFSFNDQNDISGRVILLVDDVITTGSTIEACAQLLLDNDAKEVHVASIGIAQ